MAKRNGDQLHTADKAKVRVLFAEVEGSNESIQEALNAMLSAISRPVRIISDSRVNGSGSNILEPAQPELGNELPDDVAEPSDDLHGSAPPSVVRKVRGSGKKTDRNGGLSLVPDINFRPPGKPTFKEFLEEKCPKNDVEASLAYVHYLQHVLGLAKVGASHVMTAFKEAGRPYPGDLKQTIRNIYKTKMWLKFTDLDDIRTTTQGENFVDHEMGKAEKS